MAKRRYFDHRAEVRRNLADIDEVVSNAVEQEDLLVQSYLIRYATIRLSGAVEQAMVTMVRGFLQENTSHRVLRYSSQHANRINNLNPSKLETLVRSFDEQWARELEVFLGEDERRQTLGNLIQARHDLAHGKSSSVNASRLELYRTIATETVDLLFDWFLPIK